MRILITGAAGRLGKCLTDLLSNQGHEIIAADITGENVHPLDISDFATTRNFVTDTRPDLVIHPAAWTDVDGCARNPDQAIAINGFGTQHIAIATAKINAAVLYISTNEVFDGRSTSPYREYDRPNPINPYGYSKWVGEQALQALNPQHYIVRTAWLFAHGGRNFIHAILSAAQAGKTLRVVTNEVANPTYNDDLAAAIGQLIQTQRYGIYHLVNEGACSRYHFARYFMDKVGYTDVPVTPISSHEWPRPSAPPEYAALANHAGHHTGITLRPWQQAVDAFLTKEGLI